MASEELTYCHCVISQTNNLLAKTNQWFDNHSSSFAPIFIRLILTYEFAEAGFEKLMGENWFGDLSFPFPFNLLSAEVSWNLSMGLELLGPIALLLGLATRFFSLALMVLTVVAIAAVHWPSEWHTLGELWQGYAITDKGFGNYKLPLLYLLMLASLLCSGAWWLSLDYWLSRRFLKSVQ